MTRIWIKWGWLIGAAIGCLVTGGSFFGVLGTDKFGGWSIASGPVGCKEKRGSPTARRFQPLVIPGHHGHLATISGSLNAVP
jgi:hypothetical protein